MIAWGILGWLIIMAFLVWIVAIARDIREWIISTRFNQSEILSEITKVQRALEAKDHETHP